MSSHPPDYLTAEDVRSFLQDRVPEDNPLADDGPDLFFDDQEITQASRRLAMNYNAMHPKVETVRPDRLPAEEFFLHGLAVQLLRPKLHQMMRNDFDYEAGGTSFDLQKRRIENFKELLSESKKEYLEGARTRKLTKNVKQAWRVF